SPSVNARAARAVASVDGRILGHARDELEDAAFAPQDAAPQPVGVVGEDVVGQRRLEDPVVALELLLELALAPAGVPREDPPPPHWCGVVLLVERDKAEVAENGHR